MRLLSPCSMRLMPPLRLRRLRYIYRPNFVSFLGLLRLEPMYRTDYSFEQEYWEMNEQKKTAIPKPEPVKSTSSKKGGKGGGGRGKGGDQETREEKGKISEEEGEEESPLEIAVRKVVSYKMTPKQALSEYKLTPKVMCKGSVFTKIVKL